MATALLGASEAVECAEAVTLSELAFEIAVDVDVTIVVELATDVDAVEVTATLDTSELCLATAVETAGVLAFGTSLVATEAGAETVELGVSVSDASPPKISAAVAG